MTRKNIFKYLGLVCIPVAYMACKVPTVATKTENKAVPVNFNDSLPADTQTIAKVKWNEYFTDPYLRTLIDTALKNNQELNMTLQEIEMAQNDIQARKGEYLPFVNLGAGADVDKVGRYTNIGALEDNIDIRDGHKMPDPMTNLALGAQATWEVDIWKKLHNAKDAAVQKYLATVEGKNFLVTNLIAEIANSYYELLAYDNQLDILQQNIKIQSNALEIMKYEKAATRVTELAVRRFQAEVSKTQSLQYDIQQHITETENRINFLCGRYPRKIERDDKTFADSLPSQIHVGIPSQLLDNRPDIRQAEYNLAAAKLNVKVAKARFYPSLDISAAVGYDAFSPQFLFNTPKSLVYSLAGDLIGPLVNKNAIKAEYKNANAEQIEAVYNYEKTVLNAFTEVLNQLAKIKNLEGTYAFQSKQVDALSQSIQISNDLFKSTKADYMEVLLTQRDALESKFDLIETQVAQKKAIVNIYQALGGGWN